MGVETPKKLLAESELDKSRLKESAGSKCMVRLVVASAKRHRRRQVALMYPASYRRDVVTPRPRCVLAHGARTSVTWFSHKSDTLAWWPSQVGTTGVRRPTTTLSAS